MRDLFELSFVLLVSGIILQGRAIEYIERIVIHLFWVIWYLALLEVVPGGIVVVSCFRIQLVLCPQLLLLLRLRLEFHILLGFALQCGDILNVLLIEVFD